jgi:hypothetical protein
MLSWLAAPANAVTTAQLEAVKLAGNVEWLLVSNGKVGADWSLDVTNLPSDVCQGASAACLLSTFVVASPEGDSDPNQMRLLGQDHVQAGNGPDGCCTDRWWGFGWTTDDVPIPFPNVDHLLFRLDFLGTSVTITSTARYGGPPGTSRKSQTTGSHWWAWARQRVLPRSRSAFH